VTAAAPIPWDAAKTAIRAFLGACRVVEPGDIVDGVSDPLANIVWEDEGNPYSTGDLLELRISGEETVGTDDVEEVAQLDGSTRYRITAHAEFVLSIKFNSRSQLTPARAALSVVRASFHHPDRLQILDDAGIGFLSEAAFVSANAYSDDRLESTAVLDVRLSITSELYEPLTDAPIGYLESVGISINDSPEETVESP
jgi:hypothetical protein